MFPDLAGIHAGAGANRTWYFGNPLVAVGVDLLVHKNETFATGDVNAFSRWVVPHVVRIGRSRKAGNHFARVRIQCQEARGPASRNKQAMVLFIKRHREIGSSLFELHFTILCVLRSITAIWLMEARFTKILGPFSSSWNDSG